MAVHNFKDLIKHHGHDIIAVMVYGDNENVTLECLDCNEVLIDFDNDDIMEVVKANEVTLSTRSINVLKEFYNSGTMSLKDISVKSLRRKRNSGKKTQNEILKLISDQKTKRGA